MKSVFLIGDSIRLGYERYVKAMLEGNADVYTPGDVNGGMAQFVQRWVHAWKTQQNVPDDLELVHWNAGLWDVLRIFGDDTFTSPQFYKETLVKIHHRLRMLFPKAKIVFALSTAVGGIYIHGAIFRKRGNSFREVTEKSKRGQVEDYDKSRVGQEDKGSLYRSRYIQTVLRLCNRHVGEHPRTT